MIEFENVARSLKDNADIAIKDNWSFLGSMGAFHLTPSDSLDLCRHLAKAELFEYPCWLQNDVIRMILEESDLGENLQDELIDSIFCLALTEKKGGSSFQNVAAQVARNDNIETVRGEKVFISNGNIADHIIFLARDSDQRLNLYIANTANCMVRKKMKLISPLKNYDLAEIVFADAPCHCVFPNNPLQGMFVLNKAMAIERLFCSVTMLEMSKKLLYIFTQSYKAKRDMLQDNRHWKYAYADMKKQIHLLESYVSKIETAYISGKAISPSDAAIAKSFAMDTLKSSLDIVTALIGAQCIVENSIIEKYDAYAKAFFNAGGTKEIMAEIIGADL